MQTQTSSTTAQAVWIQAFSNFLRKQKAGKVSEGNSIADNLGKRYHVTQGTCVRGSYEPPPCWTRLWQYVSSALSLQKRLPPTPHSMEHTTSATTYQVMETLLLAARMKFLSSSKPGNPTACYFTQVGAPRIFRVVAFLSDTWHSESWRTGPHGKLRFSSLQWPVVHLHTTGYSSLCTGKQVLLAVWKHLLPGPSVLDSFAVCSSFKEVTGKNRCEIDAARRDLCRCSLSESPDFPLIARNLGVTWGIFFHSTKCTRQNFESHHQIYSPFPDTSQFFRAWVFRAWESGV